ncbi:MAG: twin-arginine translocation signal domain-containing protein [Planctomycetes bacterium]|nr:twin-arginine translocation signal domain-containing protein [Planctomycetota bacterium]
MANNVSRRDFLRFSGLTAGALAAAPAIAARNVLAGPPAAPSPAPGFKATHVVFVSMAGGVRSRETIQTPANVPNLMRMAKDGVILPNIRAQNVGHYGASLSCYTGITEIMGIRENQRGKNPTIFEYMRKQRRFSANQIWLSTSGGNQQLNFAYGTHDAYGAGYGANVISGDGVFNAEFKDILEKFGRPKTGNEAEMKLVEKLQASLDPGPLSRVSGEGLTNDPATVKRIEKFILDEISAKDTGLTGPGVADAKSVRIGANILKVFKPVFLGVALNNADVAHGSFNGYVDVIRRNDDEIGKLYDAIQADPDLKDKTAIFVMPEFGRDKDLNQRNGLDHGDSSEDLTKISLIAIGPDFKKGKTIETKYESIDICPTMAHLFGVKPELSRAKVMTDVFA